jgi:Ca2+-binding RTX toxin-like protein
MRVITDGGGFAMVEHDKAFEVSNGTIAFWVRPDETDRFQTILSKDQSGSGDGGHWRIASDYGRLFLRFAEGDGGSNHSWRTNADVFTEGQWSHVAISFGIDGVAVYLDGTRLADDAFVQREGWGEPNLSEYKEAYLLNNDQPLVIGADTSRANETDSAGSLAAEDDLKYEFEGAIDGLGLWGGMEASDALNQAQIEALIANGPTTFTPEDPTVNAGNDVINGGAGEDVLYGEAGDDVIDGGADGDVIEGGYGDDRLIGGDGNDVLDGGRGSDVLLGGDGDDILISGSDAGEQTIAQAYENGDDDGAGGVRSDPDDEVDPATRRLYPDQPLKADDILVGGEGSDTFLIRPQINAKEGILFDNVNDDRTINWRGVAGENNEVHDHWVDSFGIDIIADYNAAEDHIAIIGHTVSIANLEHKDSDGDNVDDYSVITVRSNQGGGGGAHNGDLIGQVIVYGDLVNVDDVEVNPRVHYGIVDTIDELQEALAPAGDRIDMDAYDTLEVTSDPREYFDNPFLSELDQENNGWLFS